MAAKLLIDPQPGIESQGDVLRPTSHPTGGSPSKAMNRESQVRSVAVLLFLLTVAAVVFAGFNVNSEWKFLVPDDGVWWVEQGGHLTADRVDANGPGARSGIKPGDQLVSINDQDVQNMSRLERQLYRTGIWSKATYSLLRQSVPLDSSVILVSRGALPQQLAAADCTHLSWHRTLRPATPLDRSRLYPLLHFLPRLLHCLFFQIHRQA